VKGEQVRDPGLDLPYCHEAMTEEAPVLREIQEKDLPVTEKDLQVTEKDLQVTERDLPIIEKDRLPIKEKDLHIIEKDQVETRVGTNETARDLGQILSPLMADMRIINSPNTLHMRKVPETESTQEDK